MIRMQGVSKRYWRLDEPEMLIQSMLPRARPRRQELWALRDLDLTVATGETVGVVGHNGAGKTTLLRLLAGVTSPTKGRVRVAGRIAPLISLGVGFHNEMSGRENVLVNGMLLGLTARQVAERFDSIIEFAELGEFIDTPVKFYSSGMFMRLGFAVVVHVDPTILLVDEILAVGDTGFQMKCFERLNRLRDDGASTLVVSHSMHTIRQLCKRAILMYRGQVAYDGGVEGAIGAYETMFERPNASRDTTEVVEFVEQRLIGSRGDAHEVDYDDPLELTVRLRFLGRVEDPLISFGTNTLAGVFGGYTATQRGKRWRTFTAGDEAELRIAFRARMGPGRYRLVIDVRTPDGGGLLARSNDLSLAVTGRPGATGLADVGATIELERLSGR